MLRKLRPVKVAAIVLLLAACAVKQPRPRPVSETAQPSEKPASAPPRPISRPIAPLEGANVSENPHSPWERMRERFALPGCDYNADVLRWAERYSAGPTRFAASWRDAMPFVLLVLDEIERRNLPGEFALLPYVESQYRPIAVQGAKPAGMWQLMPQTATDRGLRVANDYDGRLDALDSTRVALDLIERYDREFGDWRLATMAFNSGEYRIKRELRDRTASDLPAQELARLALSPGTHEHLAKMLALACIVTDPQRFKVSLPEPQDDDHLVVQELGSPIDLRLVARLADMPVDDLRQFNAAWLHDRMIDGSPRRVLLPKDRVTRFIAARQAIPESLHADWQTYKVGNSTSLAALAETSAIAPEVLAAANGLEANANLPAGSRILIPGRERVAASANASDTHVIRTGDTLSVIARRYGVRIVELLHWNDLHANTILRLGTRLRVRAPAP
jgi:membrane-bound lytic murein transglycosylase D